MRGRDVHTNIMLDIECTAANAHNPAIIELAAVYFNRDTGEEFDYISIPVNLKSCTDLGLVTNLDTMKWLEDNIPQTLRISQDCSVSLDLTKALFKLSVFLRKCIKATERRNDAEGRWYKYSQPMIWGNRAMADNVWIRSAYHVSQLEQPWKYWSDKCLRTFVKQVGIKTGIDFSWRPWASKRIGKAHIALDDCRYQILYLKPATDEDWGLLPKKLNSATRATEATTQQPSPDVIFSGERTGSTNGSMLQPPAVPSAERMQPSPEPQLFGLPALIGLHPPGGIARRFHISAFGPGGIGTFLHQEQKPLMLKQVDP